MVAPIELPLRPATGACARAYGPWLLSKIDPTLPHTQAIVLVHDRKQAIAVESYLSHLSREAAVTASCPCSGMLRTVS